MSNNYIKKVVDIYGVSHWRGTYQNAREIRSHKHAREMCLWFVDRE